MSAPKGSFGRLLALRSPTCAERGCTVRRESDAFTLDDLIYHDDPSLPNDRAVRRFSDFTRRCPGLTEDERLSEIAGAVARWCVALHDYESWWLLPAQFSDQFAPDPGPEPAP